MIGFILVRALLNGNSFGARGETGASIHNLGELAVIQPEDQSESVDASPLIGNSPRLALLQLFARRHFAP